MDNFDLKKYLAENKLNEEETNIANFHDYPVDEVFDSIKGELGDSYNNDDVIKALNSFFLERHRFFNQYAEMDNLYNYLDFMKRKGWVK